MFDQTCFNHLATHFNISMLGHQTFLLRQAFKATKYHLCGFPPTYGVGSCFAQAKTSITKQALMEPTVEAQGEVRDQGTASNVQWKQIRRESMAINYISRG